MNVSLPEAATIWGVSSRTAYRLAALELVKVSRIGRRVTIPPEEVERVRLEGVSIPPRDAVGPPAPVLPLPRRGRKAGA